MLFRSAAGGMSALSNAMDAAPAAAAQLKDELGGTQGLAAAGGAAAAGAAGIGAISRQAAINRANGMDPVTAYQTAQQQVGGAGANSESGANTAQSAGQNQVVNTDVTQQSERSGMSPVAYPLVNAAVMLYICK